MVEPLPRKRSPRLLFPSLSRADLRRWIRSLSILQWHYVYLFLLFFVTSLILWEADSRGEAKSRISYLDALFLAISAGTGTGLNNVLLSGLNTFQQIVCYLLILVGSHIFVAAVIVNYHRIYYKRKYLTLCHDQVYVRQTGEETLPRSSGESIRSAYSFPRLQRVASLQPSNSQDLSCVHEQPKGEIKEAEGEDDKLEGMPSTVAEPTAETKNAKDLPTVPDSEYLTQGNSAVATVCDEHAAVYHALLILSILLPLYFFAFQFLGSTILAAHMSRSMPHFPALNSLNPLWFSTFNAVSAFNNSGLSLLDKNMTVFPDDWLVLVVMSILILAGNTCYPIFLKAGIWCLARIVNVEDGEKESWMNKWKAGLEVLEGDGARRLLPWLMGSKETLWLAASVMLLNIIDWVSFIASVEEGFPSMPGVSAGNRVLSGLFQAFAVRSGGFSVVAISELRTWVLVIYSYMMYTAAFPIFVAPIPTSSVPSPTRPISVETRSKDESLASPPSCTTISKITFVKSQLKSIFRYPAPDFLYLALMTFALTISEANHIQADPTGFSVMNIIFEVTSAYGCVGVSVGARGQDTAFCAAWTGVGKILLCAVMVAGRMREVRGGVAKGWKGYWVDTGMGVGE